MKVFLHFFLDIMGIFTSPSPGLTIFNLGIDFSPFCWHNIVTHILLVTQILIIRCFHRNTVIPSSLYKDSFFPSAYITCWLCVRVGLGLRKWILTMKFIATPHYMTCGVFTVVNVITTHPSVQSIMAPERITLLKAKAQPFLVRHTSWFTTH